MSASTGHVPGTGGYRRLLAALFFAGVATFAQLYSPQAVLPQLSAALGIAPAAAALAVSAGTFGLALAVIPWSAVADRVGRVPAMTFGILTASAIGAVAPLSTDTGMLLAARFAEGAALGAIPAIALAYLSEEVDARHVAAAAGTYIAGTTVGGLSGRIVSGAVGGALDWRGGMWAAAALCIAAASVFTLLVPRARNFRPGRFGALRHTPVGTRLAVNLRSATQLTLYAQGFLLMGAFVAVFNYLGFRLAGPPFSLPPALVTVIFLAYLAGTISSPWAGVLASRRGRRPVLLGATGVMAAGAAAMVVPSAPVLIAGLLVFTAGFFGAHAVASGWVPVAARPDARAQASSLYYLGYYGGSSLFGWCLGIVFGAAGWSWFVGAVVAMCALAAALAARVGRGS